MVAPLFVLLFLVSCKFPRPKGDEAHPVIAVKTNMSFLIERNKSVQ